MREACIFQMKATTTICCSLILLACCWTDVEAYCLEYYPLDDVLTDPRIYRVLVDDEGVKWFGAWAGSVVAFDEREWHNYDLSPGTGFDMLLDMCLDIEGRVWATIGDARDLFFCFDDGAFHGIPRYSVMDVANAMVFDNVGTLWAGGLDYGAGHWIGRRDCSGEWRLWTGPSSEFPVDLDVTSDGTVWFVNIDEYVFMIEEGSNKWQRFAIGQEGRNRRIASSGDGRLWLTKVDWYSGELQILFSDDWENWAELKYPDLGFVIAGGCALTAVSNEGVWFGGVDGALWYDHETWRWINISEYGPMDIAVDDITGDVWFATFDGVYVMRGGPDARAPVYIEVRLVHDPLQPEEAAFVMSDVWFEKDLCLDFYLAAQDAQGNLFFGPDFTPEMSPMAEGFDAGIGQVIEGLRLLDLDLSWVPAGTYRWYAACTYTGTMKFASNIASCEWQFE